MGWCIHYTMESKMDDAIDYVKQDKLEAKDEFQWEKYNHCPHKCNIYKK